MLDYVVDVLDENGFHGYSSEVIVEAVRPLTAPLIEWFDGASDEDVMDRFRGTTAVGQFLHTHSD